MLYDYVSSTSVAKKVFENVPFNRKKVQKETKKNNWPWGEVADTDFLSFIQIYVFYNKSDCVKKINVLNNFCQVCTSIR